MPRISRGCLVEMYQKFAEGKGWDVAAIDSHTNDHNGYRNITFVVNGKGAYGLLQREVWSTSISSHLTV